MALVPTGNRRDPFSDVCKTLFGDVLDADALRGVAKMSPDSADLHVNVGGQRAIGAKGYVNAGGGETKMPRARRVGRDAAKFLSTGHGKAVVAGGTLAGANKYRKSRNDSQRQAGYGYGYAKRDDSVAKFEGEFSKFDDDKQLAFGWASIVEMDGSPVVDKQGDYISIEDLEDAAYTYVHKSRVGGDMHRRNGESPHHVSDMVESIVFTDDKIAKMGLPDDFPRGWWVGFKVHDPQTWDEVRKGGRTGFSIHGKGIRKDVPLDEIMGYGVNKRTYDPDDERQRRTGQVQGVLGVSGAGGLGYGASGVARDTRAFRRQQQAHGNQVRDFNARMRNSKTRQLDGTNTLNSMAREGKLVGPNKTYVVTRRNAGAMLAGAGGLAAAGLMERDARSPKSRRWN